MTPSEKLMAMLFGRGLVRVDVCEGGGGRIEVVH